MNRKLVLLSREKIGIGSNTIHTNRKMIHSDRRNIGIDWKTIHLNRHAIHMTRKANRATIDMDCAVIHTGAPD